MRQLIESRGAQLLYLPPYSPDFNPIEHAWSKLKQLLRGTKARVLVQLEPAIAQVLAAITPQNARAFFRHCGYGIQQLWKCFSLTAPQQMTESRGHSWADASFDARPRYVSPKCRRNLA